jgi:hypothetical protein
MPNHLRLAPADEPQGTRDITLTIDAGEDENG